MNLGSLIGYLGLDTKDWDQGLDKAEGGLKSFAKKGAALAAAAGAGIAAAVTSAVVSGMNIEAGTDKVAAQMNLTGPDAERAGKLAGELYSGAYVGSIEEGGQLVRAVAQNMGVDINSVDFSEIAEKVANLGNGFDQDLGETTKAVGQLMKTGLAANADQALDIVTAGFQSGADASGDFLDTLNEYGVQFQKLGLDGAAATGLISQGMQAGARDSDVVADAIKEFSIRAVDGSKTTAEGFQMIGLNATQMAEQIGKGGKGASEGLDVVLDRLRAIPDPVNRSQAAVALFGTQAEDLGAALYALDPSEAVAGLGELDGRAASFGETLNGNALSALTSFKNQMLTAFVNIVGGKVLPIVTSVASFLATTFGPALSSIGSVVSGTVMPALQALGGFISDHSTTFKIIAGVITAVFLPALIAMGVQSTISAAKTVAAWVLTQASALSSLAVQSLVAVQVVAGWVLMGVQSLLQAARMAAAWLIAMGPVGWVIAAVIGLVALIVANWDTIVSWTKTAWSAVTGAIGAAWEWIKGAVSAAIGFIVNLFLNFTGPGLIIKHWDTIKNATVAAWNAVVGFITGAWNRITGAISAAVGAVKNAVSGAWNSVKSFTQNAWNAVTGVVSGAWNGIRNAVAGGVNGVINYVRNLPGQILGALGNIGSLLFSAGKNLIAGFINGIVNMFGSVKSTLGGLTSKLTSWKGPPARDAVLLRGAGQMVIGGFIGGLESQYGAVKSTLQGMTSDLAATASTTVGVNMPAMAGAGVSSGSSGAGAGVVVHGGVTVRIETPLNLTNDRDLRRAGEKIRDVIIGLEREAA